MQEKWKSCYNKETKKEVLQAGVLDVSLMESSVSLDDVVVVGYGVQKKVNVTGAVSIAKERYEKTLAMRREAYHAKKSEQTA